MASPDGVIRAVTWTGAAPGSMLAIASAGSKSTVQSVGGVIESSTFVSGAVPVFVDQEHHLGGAARRPARAEDTRLGRQAEAVAAGDLDDELLLELLAADRGRDQDRVAVRGNVLRRRHGDRDPCFGTGFHDCADGLRLPGGRRLDLPAGRPDPRHGERQVLGLVVDDLQVEREVRVGVAAQPGRLGRQADLAARRRPRRRCRAAARPATRCPRRRR